MLTDIQTSDDLATILNADTTPDEAHETPADWPGVALFGPNGLVEYGFDRTVTTATFAALADGSAAVELVGGAWQPAAREEWVDEERDAAVTLDYRTVHVGQGDFAETTTYDTVDEAKAAFAEEIASFDEQR